MKSNKNTIGVEAVNKALEILNCFTEKNEALTVTKIAQITGDHKSRISRISKSLLKNSKDSSSGWMIIISVMFPIVLYSEISALSESWKSKNSSCDINNCIPETDPSEDIFKTF